MRRPSLPNPLLVALVLVLSCTDSTTDPTSKQMVPGGGQYLYGTSGTLADEIDALSVALFPTGLETAAGTRWANVKSKLAGGDLVNAKSKLVELSRWILQKQSQMEQPGHGDTRSGAAARLVLYMSMYVYSNGTATTPTQFGGGADATVAVVTPTEPALVQTPTLRAAVAMESGTVTENTIIVVRENTTPFPRHCSGPLTTKYCQYPLFYHYESFPHVRFQKQVRVAMCHVATGTGSYGPLPGSNHNEFVVIHNKPASAADYTPGGYPVPGEDVEVLPKNPILPAVPIVACSGTTYSPSTIALLTAPHGSTGALGTALAVAARAVNRAATSIGRLLTPKDAYAVDVGEEHNTLFFSDFANADTLAHPDLAISATSASVSSVEPGGGITLGYTLSNVGTAHSPTVSTVYELTPTAPTTGPAITLTSSSTPGVGPLYPTESVMESVVLTVPSTVSPGTYTVGATVSSAGGLSEVTLGNNTGTVAITVRAREVTVNVPFGATIVPKVCTQQVACGEYFEQDGFTFESFWFQPFNSSDWQTGHFHAAVDGTNAYEAHHAQGDLYRQGIWIHRADGQPFSLKSIDYRNAFDSGTGAAPFEIGTNPIVSVGGSPSLAMSAGGIAYTTFPVTNSPSFQTLLTPGFTNVTNAWITMRGTADWDNITLTH